MYLFTKFRFIWEKKEEKYSNYLSYQFAEINWQYPWRRSKAHAQKKYYTKLHFVVRLHFWILMECGEAIIVWKWLSLITRNHIADKDKTVFDIK